MVLDTISEVVPSIRAWVLVAGAVVSQFEESSTEVQY